jgi:hypothetical protein
MQALGLFSQRAILGRSNKSTVVLEKIAKENSLNRTGAVNFNKYGKQDSVGFTSCSEKLMDNFLLYEYVPDYFVTAKKTYIEVGLVNKHIRDMLYRFGLIPTGNTTKNVKTMRRLYRMTLHRPEMDSEGQMAPTRVSLTSSRPQELLIGQFLRNVRDCDASESKTRHLEKFKINISTRRTQMKFCTRKRLNTKSILHI